MLIARQVYLLTRANPAAIVVGPAASAPSISSPLACLSSPTNRRSFHWSAAAASTDWLTTPCLRNVGIVAHVDAGKTTTAERILFYSGLLKRIGDVDNGDTAMDHLAMERERGITIQSAATTFNWRQARLNLIDTPGHVDFTVEVERSVRVLDGCVLVLDGVKGVQAQTVTVWRQLARYAVPTLVFLNKLDMEGASVTTSLHSVQKLLNVQPVPVQLVVPAKGLLASAVNSSWIVPQSRVSIARVVDLIEWRVLTFEGEWGETVHSSPPEEALSDSFLVEAKKARDDMLEQLAAYSDPVADRLLEGRDVEASIIHQELRKCTIARQLIPAFCGSSLRNAGVQPLLDAVLHYLPDPFERPPPAAIDSSSSSSPIEADSSSTQLTKTKGKSRTAPVGNTEDFGRALAFKVVHDIQKGLIVWIRVYEGVLKSGALLQNGTIAHRPQSGGKEQATFASQLLKLDCESTKRVEELQRGDIGALVGLSTVATGDTLVFPNPTCQLKHKVLGTTLRQWADNNRLPGMALPSPVFTRSVEAARQSEQTKLENALKLLCMEDPSVRAAIDPDSGQYTLSGMGELHLEIIMDRLINHYRVDASFGSIRISYHATLSDSIDDVYTEWEGPKIGSAALTISLARSDDGAFHFNDALQYPDDDEDGGGIFPSDELRDEVLAAIEEGLRDACIGGAVHTYGCPLQQLRVDLKSVVWSSESTPIAFRAAAVRALGTAIAQKPDAVLFLQPRMLVRVETPREHMGNVSNDLIQRHGSIVNVEVDEQELVVIEAQVPLANLLGYSGILRSMTRGSGHFSMEFSEYSDINSSSERDRVLLYLRGY